MTMDDDPVNVFGDIYRRNAWNGIESLSGPGSGPVATQHLAGQLLSLVDELGITSVLDVGCGDAYWMPELPGYIGIDITREAVERANRRHPHRLHIVWDMTAWGPVPEQFDLVFTRDVIQHLNRFEGSCLLDAIRMMRPRYLLASTYVGGSNVDIETGDAYSPDLSVAPFNLGQPERLIFDGYTYHDPDAVRDPAKHMGLWKL